MPVEVDVCEHYGIKEIGPELGEGQVCYKGHGASQNCTDQNECPDYKKALAYKWEEK